MGGQLSVEHSAERWGLAPVPFATGSTRNLALLILTVACAFAVASRLKPLYYANQHTKFLHAMASAGFGYLREDWLVHTKDGLPLFTALVKVIYLTLGPAGFYIAAFAGYV